MDKQEEMRQIALTKFLEFDKAARAFVEDFIISYKDYWSKDYVEVFKNPSMKELSIIPKSHNEILFFISPDGKDFYAADGGSTHDQLIGIVGLDIDKCVRGAVNIKDEYIPIHIDMVKLRNSLRILRANPWARKHLIGFIIVDIDEPDIEYGLLESVIREELTDDDKRDLLDLEADMVDLKQRLMDTDNPEEKEAIKQDMEYLKQDMEDIKAYAET